MPDVFEYLDVLVYLKEYYRFRKQEETGFSYEQWAAELELTSRSFLRLMVTGKKKITSKFVDSFCLFVFDKNIERQFFRQLVMQAQASSEKQRAEGTTQILKLLRQRIESESFDVPEEFASDPLLIRLFALLSFVDIQADITEYARLLRVDEKTMKAAFSRLAEMQLIEQSDVQGVIRWVAKSSVFKIPDSYGSFNLRHFHQRSLEQAIEAFDRPKEERRYKSLLLPLSHEELQDLHQRVDDFSQDQMVRHNTQRFKGKRLYQLNVNIYAVTDEP